MMLHIENHRNQGDLYRKYIRWSVLFFSRLWRRFGMVLRHTGHRVSVGSEIDNPPATNTINTIATINDKRPVVALMLFFMQSSSSIRKEKASARHAQNCSKKNSYHSIII